MLIKFTSEKEWLEARARDITSTDIAALFGLSPHKSRLRLWQEKAGYLDPEFEENQFTIWGKRLQVPVAMGICEDEGWAGEDLTGTYSTFPDLRLGSSYDVLVKCSTRGKGHLEVKVAEEFREEDGWTKERAPLTHEFQMANQLHCAAKDEQGLKFNCLGILGRRQRIRLYFREYDRELGQMIDHEVSSFWASITADIPPKPDYSVDADILEKLRKPLRSGDVINLTGNNRAHDLIQTWFERSAARKALIDQIKPLEKDMKTIEAELHDIMGRNEIAIIGDYQIRAKVQVNEERIQHETSFRRFDPSKRRK